MRKISFFSVLTILTLVLLGSAWSQTLEKVRKRGVLKCGVTTGLGGFSNPDSKGHWKGLDVDYCKAVAAAVFENYDGSDDFLEFVPLSAKERFTSLQSGEVDVLSRISTWTMTRDASLGINFIGVTFYDGQVFLVRKSAGINSATQLGGASVCVETGTTTELNADDYFRTNKIDYTPVVFGNKTEAVKAYDSERCDVFTTDGSGVIAIMKELKDPNGSVILPEIISKEPLSPAVRQGDDQWFNIAKWVYFTLINAEELGITSSNIEKLKKEAKDPQILRVIGKAKNYGKSLGLDSNWSARLIKYNGNYGEIFERNVGSKSSFNLERGLNDLWTKGGLMYAPPIR